MRSDLSLKAQDLVHWVPIQMQQSGGSFRDLCIRVCEMRHIVNSVASDVRLQVQFPALFYSCVI